jgi:FkbM family methyltransferase
VLVNAIAFDSQVVRPGAFLRFKALVPNRLRHAFAAVERALYGRDGVVVWLDDRPVRCAIDAAPVFLSHPDHGEDRLLMQHVFESLQPGDAFLDVGSHVGLYAIGAAGRVGMGGRVTAFEPTPDTVVKLAHNLALNRLSGRVQIEQVALSDSCGGVDFVTSGTSMMNSIFAGAPEGHRRPGGPPRCIRVRTEQLDRYFSSDRRTVAKIDTEGHELFVLRGAPNVLASEATIFVELHPWAWQSEEASWKELTGLCERHRRRIQLLDGTPLDHPAHRRVELARLAA